MFAHILIEKEQPLSFQVIILPFYRLEHYLLTYILSFLQILVLSFQKQDHFIIIIFSYSTLLPSIQIFLAAFDCKALEHISTVQVLLEPYHLLSSEGCQLMVYVRYILHDETSEQNFICNDNSLVSVRHGKYGKMNLILGISIKVC